MRRRSEDGVDQKRASVDQKRTRDGRRRRSNGTGKAGRELKRPGGRGRMGAKRPGRRARSRGFSVGRGCWGGWRRPMLSGAMD